MVILPVSNQDGLRPVDLEEGSTGIIDNFVREFYSKWLMKTELVLGSFNRAEVVLGIKGHERTQSTSRCQLWL